jgi:hypothetical protein
MQWSLYNTIALGIGIWTFGSCIGLPEVNCAASVNGHGSYFRSASVVNSISRVSKTAEQYRRMCHHEDIEMS